MNESGGDPALAAFIGERLQAQSDRLVARWIEWVRSRIRNPTIETLPERALRNHIPPVVRSIGRYVADPSYAVRAEMLGHLRLHAQMRRDQGYQVQDLLAEFDGLSQLILSAMQREVVEGAPEAPVHEALTVFGRLATGIRAVAFVTVSVFDRSEDERRQDMAGKLSRFTQAISHELRSPIQSAKLIATLLFEQGDESDGKTRRQQAEIIRSSMERVEGLLEEIDLLALAEHAHTQPRLAPLPGLCEQVREELISRAQAKGVRLEFAPELPMVAVERVIVQLALVNLIGNAIKYADPEKTDRWVRIDAQVTQQEDTPIACIQIEDNGLGIAEEYQSRVFQRGFRAHPDVAEGTGLGLAIIQELILGRGGTIGLDSQPQVGTQVRFTLRVTDVTAAQASLTDQPDRLMRQSLESLLTGNTEDPDRPD